MSKEILIIGKTPPPTGGVTIHVSRILEKLKKEKTNFTFEDLSYRNIFKIFYKILKYKNIHLHTNSTYLQFLFILISKILNKNSILTIHAEIGQHKDILRNQLELFSIKFAKFPIILNLKSYNIVKKFNVSAILDSAYICPINKIDLPIGLKEIIYQYRNKYKKIYCTNAYNRVFDKNGVELYGIDELIKIFEEKKYLLLVCDPSGSYSNYYSKKIFQNTYFINYPIEFTSLLNYVDGFIRNTSSDGDSISIHEALQLNKPVFCTKVVDRPKNVILYSNAFNELPDLLDQTLEITGNNYIFSENRIFDIYKKITK